MAFNARHFSSLHTHTLFDDGRDDIESMCKAAFEKGLCAIGFSSHAPIEKAGFTTTWNMKENRMAEYAKEVKAAGRRWEGKIAVYLGFEVDYIKGLRSVLDGDIQDIKPDYLISSVHYILSSGKKPFTIDGSVIEIENGITEGFNGSGEAMMHAYWDAVIEMTSLGGFDIVGHLDLVKKGNLRNPSKRFFDMENNSIYMQRAGEAVQAIAAGGFLVEINTGMINRNYFSETCPSLPILRLLKQYNVPIIISADAHNAGDIDGNYQLACKTLLQAGYNSHFLFTGRNSAGKALWQEQEI